VADIMSFIYPAADAVEARRRHLRIPAKHTFNYDVAVRGGHPEAVIQNLSGHSETWGVCLLKQQFFAT